MSNEHPKYWFAAKRYGFGWGLPLAWQGWIVYVVLLLAVALLATAFPPGRSPGLFAGGVVVLVVLLALVCWLKGEPPHWRWGGE